ncbi:tRNA 2-selenouridine(34) synthase MnmH [Sulfitobacter sp.]|jgi:tRNA 2-selenouridine synthase|uniref:tRNA 2-selenouridine(34) synthase MnmH n=1 Tax=Sulfitobacter sp. TaxID=1903071 RepID=UPI003EF975FD
MTPLILTSLAQLQGLAIDTIIDVRAPAEYAQDHLPGAINMPVLNDAERAEVGTIYARVSPFKARKVGGALVAQNTARHLQGPLVDKDGAWQPLVYCWRGGQRSNAFATILDQVGWRVQLLENGYKSYRTQVVKTLYEMPLPHRLMLIDGGTGTAKTALLHQLGAQGAQILDLEGLAAHRGSLFGGVSDPQPAQKMFESRIALTLSTLDPEKITFVEAESSKIGERMLPSSLWALMGNAPRIRITAPLDARSRFLCNAYADLTRDGLNFSNILDRLRPYHSAAQIEQWQKQVGTEDWQTLAAGLITKHYDPRYAKSVARNDVAVHDITLPDLSSDTLARTSEVLRTRFI